MKKIKLYIAASIDGYIARIDGNLDWLLQYPINPDTNYGYDAFYQSVDTLIMGGRTYRDILHMDTTWPYTGKTTYVITRNPMEPRENIYYITDHIIETISTLQQEKGKDIWLIGGGEIIAMLLAHKAIHEIVLFTIPVMLGNGIPLFPSNLSESQWNLTGSEAYANGILQTTYELK